MKAMGSKINFLICPSGKALNRIFIKQIEKPARHNIKMTCTIVPTND